MESCFEVQELRTFIWGTAQAQIRSECMEHIYLHLGVSKNRGTPKWMVYNGKPY